MRLQCAVCSLGCCSAGLGRWGLAITGSWERRREGAQGPARAVGISGTEKTGHLGRGRDSSAYPGTEDVSLGCPRQSQGWPQVPSQQNGEESMQRWGQESPVTSGLSGVLLLQMEDWGPLVPSSSESSLQLRYCVGPRRRSKAWRLRREAQWAAKGLWDSGEGREAQKGRELCCGQGDPGREAASRREGDSESHLCKTGPRPTSASSPCRKEHGAVGEGPSGQQPKWSAGKTQAV